MLSLNPWLVDIKFASSESADHPGWYFLHDYLSGSVKFDPVKDTVRYANSTGAAMGAFSSLMFLPLVMMWNPSFNLYFYHEHRHLFSSQLAFIILFLVHNALTINIFHDLVNVFKIFSGMVYSKMRYTKIEDKYAKIRKIWILTAVAGGYMILSKLAIDTVLVGY